MLFAARSLGLVCLVPLSILASVFLAGLNTWAPPLRRRCQPAMMRTWFQTLAYLWGLTVEVNGTPVDAPALLACNHRSWLDIIALGATLPGTFVSKAEIDRWPLVGYFARHGGRTLYISRGEMRSFKALGGELIGRLRDGGRVIFFPEGGVSGERVLLRFRPRLFEAALAVDCPVQPVAILYTGGDGEAYAPLGEGDKFVFHALRLLRCRRTEVRLDFLAPITSGATDAKFLAKRAQAQVAEVLFGAGDGIGADGNAKNEVRLD